jgi:hypothetical protein
VALAGGRNLRVMDTDGPATVTSWVSETITALLADTLDRACSQSIQPAAWHLPLGPAAASAWMWRHTGEERFLDLAIEHLDQCRIPVAGCLPRLRSKLHATRWSCNAAIEAGATLGWILLGLGEALDE